MASELPERIVALLGRVEPRRAFSVSEFEFRSRDEHTYTFEGYASVFDVDYDMYGGPPYGWTERVDAHAFDKTLREKPDVVFLVNHAGLPLARTKSGTLDLSVDAHGLHVRADLAKTDPDVVGLATKMERGDVDEMSFAFRTIRQEWNEDYTERTLTEVSIHRGDVSVVTFGANPYTDANLRALLAQIEKAPEALVAELRASGVEDPIAVVRSAHDALGKILAPTSSDEPVADERSENSGNSLAYFEAIAATL